MPEYKLTVNGQARSVNVAANTPLLWVLRDSLGMTGTKFGCGISQCGACTIHVDGRAIRSCVTPVTAGAGKKITTIEGLSADKSHVVQKAWIEEQVPQCGYCQSGMIMTTAALLSRNATPSEAEIDTALSGHICRCGTYPRIRKAIARAAKKSAAQSGGAQ